MELLYCWCGNVNDGRVQDLELNFGGKYIFSYKDNILKCKENSDYIESFFSKDGTVSNITVIVGENGAGKTSTLKAILRSAFNSLNFADVKPVEDQKSFRDVYISIFLINDELHIYRHNTYFKDVEFSEGIQNKIKYLIYPSPQPSPLPLPPPLPFPLRLKGRPIAPTKLAGYYFSNSGIRGDDIGRDLHHWSNNVHASDLSPDREENRQFVRILEMLGARAELRNHVESSKFSLPEYCEIRMLFKDVSRNRNFVEEETLFGFRQDFYREVNKLVPLPDMVGHRRNSRQIDAWLRKGINREIYDVFVRYILSIHSTDTRHNISDEMVGSIASIKGAENPHRNIDLVLSAMRGRFGDNSISNSRSLDAVIGLIEYLRNLYRGETRNGDSSSIYDGRFREFTLSIDNAENSVFKFIEKYKSAFQLNGLKLSLKQFSHGEYAFLDVLTALHLAENGEFKKIPQGRSDNTILILDEGDACFHPNWEKQYISLLIEFAQALFCGRKIQLILTSNKPVILSDMPKNNVIFLHKDGEGRPRDCSDNQVETFAQNIYTLYSRPFFMKNGLLGDFAKSKIRELVERISALSPSDADTDEVSQLEKIISQVGEEILRTQLNGFLDNQLERDKSVEEELAYHRQRIEELENTSRVTRDD